MYAILKLYSLSGIVGSVLFDNQLVIKKKNI